MLVVKKRLTIFVPPSVYHCTCEECHNYNIADEQVDKGSHVKPNSSIS